jgi:hypothetical protein
MENGGNSLLRAATPVTNLLADFVIWKIHKPLFYKAVEVTKLSKILVNIWSQQHIPMEPHHNGLSI